MSDFFSQGWSWYISIISIVSLVGYAIIAFLNGGKGDNETTGHVWDEDLMETDRPIPKWWLGMLGMATVFAFGYLLLYPGLGSWAGILGWTQNNQYDQEVADAHEQFGPLFAQYAGTDMAVLATDKEAMKTGRRLFQTHCAVCHGSDARGAVNFPNLRDQDWLYGGSPQAIKTTIVDGRHGVMPAWASVLGNDLDDVTRYVLSLSNDGKGEDIEIGKKRFQEICTACHGVDGRGNQDIGAPNLTDNIWLYGGKFDDIEDVLINGRDGIMPAHKKVLTDDKIHILSAYIYSLSNE